MDDPYDLQRFVAAQEPVYAQALSEIRSGRKRSHWMWFIFPQMAGLGASSTSQNYGIKSLDEAKAYLAHPVLDARLRECVKAALAVEGKSASEIFGWPDDMKLRSCATLFARASGGESEFTRLLEKFFDSKEDERTIQLIESR